MTWRRRARLLIAVVGLTCAAAVFYFGRRHPVPQTPSPLRPLDPQANSAAVHGQVFRWDNGKKVYQIAADELTEYPDHTLFKGHVHLTSTRTDKTFDIQAEAMDERGGTTSRSAPSETTATGNVIVTSSDGLDLRTDTLTYHDSTGLANIPGHVKVTRGRLTADGQGATWNRDSDVLSLLDAAHVVVVADDDGTGALEATSKSMQINRPGKAAFLEGSPRVVRDKQTLVGDSIVMRFTADEQGLDAIEQRGHSSITSPPDAKDVAPDMTGDDITLKFYPDGRNVQRSTMTNGASLAIHGDNGLRKITAQWIDARTAPDGRTVTGLDAKDHVDVTMPETTDSPARHITAATLAAKGDDKKGLTSARFDGGVDFVETRAAKNAQPALSRTARSSTLVLSLNGGIDAVTDAEFRQDVTFKDADMSATADWAKYTVASGDLLLRRPDPSSKNIPHVVNGTVEASAQEIAVSGSHDVDASGDVKTTTKGESKDKKPGPNKSPGFFDDAKPIHGTSTRFQYSDKSGKATYTADAKALARVFQDQDSVRADLIVIERETNNLNATGHVESTFQVESSFGATSTSKDKSPAENVATAKQMTYTDADRKAVYVGESAVPASLKGPDGKMTAGRIVIFLATEQRSLDRLEAEGAVEMTLAGNREAIGDHLTYRAANDEYVLEGTAGKTVARVKAPNTDGSGQCTLYTALKITFYRTGGVLPYGGGGPTNSETISCDKSIKTIK